MIPFADATELRRAMDTFAQWMPAMLEGFEQGLPALGVTITKRTIARADDSTVYPTFHIEGRHGPAQLGLRNAIEDFLLVDRDEQPARYDARLDDDAFACRKLADVIDGRLQLVRALQQSATMAEARETIAALGDRFARLRVGSIEKEP